MNIDFAILKDSSAGPLDELLTVPEVAALLKVPKSWIYEHTRKRGMEQLPHIKLGKYLRFDEGSVRAFLDRRKSA